MKNSTQTILPIVALLLLVAGGCDATIQVSTTPQTSQETSKEQPKDEPKKAEESKAPETSQEPSNEEKPSVNIDYNYYSKNYFKYKDFSINFIPKDNNDEIHSEEKYDVVLTKGDKKNTLFKDQEAGIYDNVMAIHSTNDPYIVGLTPGFGDAGFASFKNHFINLQNNKKIVIGYDSHDQSDNANSNITLNNFNYSLLTTDKPASCSKDLEVKNILRNNKPVLTISKPFLIPCQSDFLDFNNGYFELAGTNKDFSKIYLVLSASTASFETVEIKANFEIDVKTGEITELTGDDWKKDLIKMNIE